MAQQQRRALRSSAIIPLRSSRNAKPNASYVEPSSDEELRLSETEGQEDSDLQTQSRDTSKTASSKSRRHYLKSKVVSTSVDAVRGARKRKRHKNGHTRYRSATELLDESTSHFEDCGNGKIPLWATLPYEILVLIFQYASYPLCNERSFHALPAVDWLLKVSKLGRAFTEPALTVLYRSPPLVPMERAHRLRDLLVADPEPMSYNYRAKIERLQMEVVQTAAYTLPGSGILDLYGLVYNCPRLLDLEFYHQKDFSPYRKLLDSIKWTYPDSVFVALNRNVSGSPTKLRSWRWSSRMAGKKRPIERLMEVHQSPSFSSLRKISFVNYQKVWVRQNVEDPEHEKLLANSLKVLLSLEHLVFESSSLVNSTLLPLLPTQLKHLEIINCSEVYSDDLAAFLFSHGSQLRTLTLNHNISLNLSFLKVLGSCCQQLEALRMNLTYYNTDPWSSSVPGYSVLLDIDDRPNWPASLRVLELSQLREWDVEIAKMFFQSLLENAQTLVNLRRLIIKAILNMSWRDRSSFRDEWTGAFERVFKRPIDNLGDKLRDTGDYSQLQIPNMRRSGRHVAVEQKSRKRQLESLDADSSVSDSGQRARASSHNNRRKYGIKRESENLRTTAGVDGQKSYKDTSRNDASSDFNSESDDMPLAIRRHILNVKKAEHIQGMCDVVSIIIDNLRPTENQFVEADFLDSEPEGDGDWDGSEEPQGGGAYAW